MNPEESLPRLSRRQVLAWFAAAAAASQMAPLSGFSQAAAPAAAGYGKDPVLNKDYQPGAFWPLTLSAKERKAVIALADVILPADDLGPAASSLRVQDFIDEWVSAPYPQQQKDRGTILPGIAWLDAESQRRFQKDFCDLAASEQRAICDDLCKPEPAGRELRNAASFFRSFTSLCMGAYYGTPEGWKAIGYVGNTPLASFDGPPPEMLSKLGLEQTVK